ncbi:MAG: helix-turn-helix transcriptional regulator [Oscillospiraceae bacterium]|nr:helix-turn-helix transcriptional regulator [Oscillospiraceae bacterium]
MDARLIGRRVQTLRRARGLTQEQLSQMVELSPNYLSNIETGLKTPKLETLVRLMNALQCDANALLADVVDNGFSGKRAVFRRPGGTAARRPAPNPKGVGSPHPGRERRTVSAFPLMRQA